MNIFNLKMNFITQISKYGTKIMELYSFML